ncbi:MAG: glycerol-3-phosphate dehydrogenase, partial [Betaproteobacteria bacterium HGW-Betaproteobacteria-21]
MKRMHISVFGAGAWGTALAQTFCADHKVTLWGRDPLHIDEIRSKGENQRYLPGLQLHHTLALTADFDTAACGADLHLVVTPLAGLRGTARALSLRQPGTPLIWACKGLEGGSGRLPHEIVTEELGPNAACGVLTGPSFAAEV